MCVIMLYSPWAPNSLCAQQMVHPPDQTEKNEWNFERVGAPEPVSSPGFEECS
jgi:hypothetical protein